MNSGQCRSHSSGVGLVRKGGVKTFRSQNVQVTPPIFSRHLEEQRIVVVFYSIGVTGKLAEVVFCLVWPFLLLPCFGPLGEFVQLENLAMVSMTGQVVRAARIPETRSRWVESRWRNVVGKEYQSLAQTG